MMKRRDPSHRTAAAHGAAIFFALFLPGLTPVEAGADVPFPSCATVGCADPTDYGAYLHNDPANVLSAPTPADIIPNDFRLDAGDAWKYMPGTGLNIVNAWGLSTGRPDVVIAVLDSGIFWGPSDATANAALGLKAALNTDELPIPVGCPAAVSPHQPSHDCNADGVVNVLDFEGQRCPGGIVSDANGNRNGSLDAQDLILICSDGVDGWAGDAGSAAHGFVGHISGSDVLQDRNEWDKTFAVDWFGVYYNTRAFMPMLLASTEGHLINTSSVNGFWACLGNDTPHTSYSAAKFAVKGFTEALQVDLRLNAPHVKASLVMPGHIGTSIGINTRKILGGPEPEDLTAADLAQMRARMIRRGMAAENTSDEQLRHAIKHAGEDFRDNAPCSSAQAATIILDGVRNEQWRILVGEDAKMLDQMVRTYAETIYDPTFMETLREEGEFSTLFVQDGSDTEKEE